jgi:hypothetical protein
MSAIRRSPMVEHTFAHGNAAFTGSEPVMPPQAVEAGIVRRAVLEHFLIERDKFSADPRLFRRNAPMKPAAGAASRHGTLARCRLNEQVGNYRYCSIGSSPTVT